MTGTIRESEWWWWKGKEKSANTNTNNIHLIVGAMIWWDGMGWLRRCSPDASVLYYCMSCWVLRDGLAGMQMQFLRPMLAAGSPQWIHPPTPKPKRCRSRWFCLLGPHSFIPCPAFYKGGKNVKYFLIKNSSTHLFWAGLFMDKDRTSKPFISPSP